MLKLSEDHEREKSLAGGGRKTKLLR
jgi:hypothetical protein